MGDESRGIASHVLLLIESVYLTLPVDILSDGSTGCDTSFVSLVARSILIEQEPTGTGLLHLIEHLSEMVFTTEKDEKHCNICLCRWERGGIIVVHHYAVFSVILRLGFCYLYS